MSDEELIALQQRTLQEAYQRQFLNLAAGGDTGGERHPTVLSRMVPTSLFEPMHSL